MPDADSHGWGTDTLGWGDDLWGSGAHVAEAGSLRLRRRRPYIDPLVWEGLIQRRGPR